MESQSGTVPIYRAGNLPWRVQIVGYERRVGGDPATLLLAENGDIRRTSLAAGERLDLGLGERHCAGRHDEETHEACIRPEAPYCDVHTDTWPCARCQGNCAMPIEDCYEEHAIYLAAFAPDVVKVGVTKRWRLERRLEEQGADRAAHIRTVEDGRRARAIEAELAVDLTDRVRVPTKVRSLHTGFDESAWETALEPFDVLDRFSFDYDIVLDHRPVTETVATGTVLGTKGRLLVIERGGTIYAVDMRDLVGHVVDADAAEDLQSSLGAFD